MTATQTDNPPDHRATRPNSQLSRGVTRSSGSFELVFSAGILALVGLGLDTLLGWRPILTIALAVAGAIGATASIYYKYREAMKQ